VKRFFALLAVGAALAAALAVPSGAVDTQGPPCADIVGDTIGYLVLDPLTGEPLLQPVLEGDLVLASPSCAAVTYTLYIYASDETTPLATQTITGVSGKEAIHFRQTFNGDGEPTADLEGLCLVATTSLGRHVADRAPDDEGCIPVEPDSSGGVGFQ
jgi:hypothetical protein